MSEQHEASSKTPGTIERFIKDGNKLVKGGKDMVKGGKDIIEGGKDSIL